MILQSIHRPKDGTFPTEKKRSEIFLFTMQLHPCWQTRHRQHAKKSLCQRQMGAYCPPG
jgi:hypothetical protein